ncbi:hypothetical protein E1B28_010742 [Marasmius oreades]|uniref:Uncharacterized protein n=1 Tax=Marasmius oreades TaxID=181124 RepID=A0A9P7RTP4_9AGAR|nr:uncharacterized protein E1B28_010742 [Marasmius oreades]KAG7089031.1 hypothetical protein E1B28_010742 [Marasmius oreades]
MLVPSYHDCLNHWSNRSTIWRAHSNSWPPPTHRLPQAAGYKGLKARFKASSRISYIRWRFEVQTCVEDRRSSQTIYTQDWHRLVFFRYDHHSDSQFLYTTTNRHPGSTFSSNIQPAQPPGSLKIDFYRCSFR